MAEEDIKGLDEPSDRKIVIIDGLDGKWNLTEKEASISGLLRKAMESDKETDEIQLKEITSNIGIKACVAYMQICATHGEGNKMEVKPLPHNNPQDFLGDNELGLFHAIFDACGENKYLRMKTLNAIAEVANYLETHEFLLKICAVISITLKQISDWAKKKEYFDTLIIPGDFNWTIERTGNKVGNILDKHEIDEKINHVSDDSLSEPDEKSDYADPPLNIAELELESPPFKAAEIKIKKNSKKLKKPKKKTKSSDDDSD